MDIIKEWTVKLDSSVLVIFRTSTYGRSFEHIQALVNEAKTEYPFLKDSDINVVVFGGDRYKGTYGIEFGLSYMRIKMLAYQRISQAPLLLA